MKTVYLVHGWEGSPGLDWLPWAVRSLEQMGFKAIAPGMPNPDEPEIEAWVNHLEQIVPQVDENVYFVGHSVGCQAIMRFLEKRKQRAGGAVFVAGWFNLMNLEDEESEAIAKPWMQTPIDTDAVRRNLGFSAVILSTNDEWVQFEQTKKEFENRLGSEIIAMPDAGHITAEDGFEALPQLAEIFEHRVGRS